MILTTIPANTIISNNFPCLVIQCPLLESVQNPFNIRLRSLSRMRCMGAEIIGHFFKKIMREDD